MSDEELLKAMAGLTEAELTGNYVKTRTILRRVDADGIARLRKIADGVATEARAWNWAD